MGLALLPAGEDGQGVPPADESGGSCPPQRYHAVRYANRSSGFFGGKQPGRDFRFQSLCSLAGIKPRLDIETSRVEPWELKDVRKTCASYHDENVAESSAELLGHSIGGSPTATIPAWHRWRSGQS